MVRLGCDYEECWVNDRHTECAAKGLGDCWGPLEHQHTPKRSQGGTKCWVMLCTGHHGGIDSTSGKYEGYRLGNELVFEPSQSRTPHCTYVITDKDTGEILREIPLG